MTLLRQKLLTGHCILLFIACVSGKLLEEDDSSIKSEGLIPAYHVERTEEIAGSGDGKADDVEERVSTNNVKSFSEKCDCTEQKSNTTPLKNENKGPVILTSTPSSVIVIIVVLSIMVLACIITIAYLLGRIKHLRRKQKQSAPKKSADDYDSDEYSVMMDWSEHPNIVKKTKYKIHN